MDLTTNLQGGSIDLNISKSMPLMDQNSNSSRPIELYNNSPHNPSLFCLQNMSYDDKSHLGIQTFKDSLKSLVNDKAHLQSRSSSDSKPLSPSSCQSNWDSTHLQKEILSSISSDKQNVKSSNGSTAPYKELTWREKDRRRRFREEWKHTWMVVPHGNYEVLCLICQKIMTQRKLDTIKRHTVRRHSEILSMDESAKCHYFEKLTAKHGLTNSIDNEEHSVNDTPVTNMINSDSIDESSVSDAKELSLEEKNENVEHISKQSPSIDDEPSFKRKKHMDNVNTSCSARNLTIPTGNRNSSTSNCQISNLSCSMPPSSLSPPYPPSGAMTFRPQVIIPRISSPSGKSQPAVRGSLPSFDRTLQSSAGSLPGSFNLQYYYMYHDFMRRPHDFMRHLPPAPQNIPANISQLAGSLTSPNSISENHYWCPPNLNFHSNLHKPGFFPPLLTHPDNHKNVDLSIPTCRSNHYPVHDTQSTSNLNIASRNSLLNVKRSLSSPESNPDICGLPSPVQTNSVDNPTLITKHLKGQNGYHINQENSRSKTKTAKAKLEDSPAVNSSKNKTLPHSPHLPHSAMHSGPLLCKVLRYHKEQDVLHCLNKFLLSEDQSDEIFILSCSGELSKATLSYRCRSDTSSVVSKAVTHEGPLEILSMSCSVSKHCISGDKLRLTVSFTDSNGCVIGGRVGGPLIVGNDGVEILLGCLKSSNESNLHQQKDDPGPQLSTYSINDQLNDQYKTIRRSLSKGKRFRVGLKGRITTNERNIHSKMNNSAIKRKRNRINAIRKTTETCPV